MSRCVGQRIGLNAAEANTGKEGDANRAIPCLLVLISGVTREAAEKKFLRKSVDDAGSSIDECSVKDQAWPAIALGIVEI